LRFQADADFNHTAVNASSQDDSRGASVALTATPGDAGARLDQFLRLHFPQHSRALLQQWIKSGNVRIGGQAAKASQVLRGNETIAVEPAERPPLRATPEDLPVEILYEDPAVIAVNKPAGMVVHAGSGVHRGTLVNALLHRFQQLSSSGGPLRPGIVHRLDKDTSGVLLVARNDDAHRRLAEQFSSRSVEKTYVALVEGRLKQDVGRIDTPITRDPDRRVRMTTRLGRGRAAHSEYRVRRRLAGHTLLEVKIGTGRTHQIRVHLSSIGHPVAGDRLYGARATGDGRFFLHARRIVFESPATGERVAVEAPLPAQLEAWLARCDMMPP
jgi:23S rRNA pseudouridine1911/1915/1917 synthase